MDWLPIAQALAVPVVGIAARIITRPGGRRRTKRLRQHTELREIVPEGLRAPLDSLIEAELRDLCDAEQRRLGRKLDGGSVAALIFFIVIGALFLAGGLALGRWWSITVGVIVGVVAILFIAVGSQQLYQYPDDDQEQSSASEATEPTA